VRRTATIARARRGLRRPSWARSNSPNTPPTAGLQFFGHVAIDGQSEAMKVTLKDVAGADLWSTVLEPARG
jgi:phosphodiesterase/alkaline phosphatase D-like protein